MDLTGYITDLESLISRYTILILVKAAAMILVIFLIWLVPYLEKRTKKKPDKHKTKRKIRLEKVAKRNLLIFQVVFSVLFVIIGALYTNWDIKTLKDLKADAIQDSVAVYEGDATLVGSSYIGNANVFLDLIVDSRSVFFGDSNEIYHIDMSEVDEGWFEDWGDFHGKITYGENSKFILKIE